MKHDINSFMEKQQNKIISFNSKKYIRSVLKVMLMLILSTITAVLLSAVVLKYMYEDQIDIWLLLPVLILAATVIGIICKRRRS